MSEGLAGAGGAGVSEGLARAGGAGGSEGLVGAGSGGGAGGLEDAAPAAPGGAPLGEAFFARSVHEVARDLIGCSLRVDGVGGVIVETESYHASEPACHAYVGLTARTEPLFGPPGRAYVYLSYGVHCLLNAVAEPEGEAAAVLIRALEPVWGIEAMRARRGRDELGELCSGPGKLTEALGVDLDHNRRRLTAPPFELRAPTGRWREPEIVTGPRVGITRAAELPWRYCVRGSRFVSRPRPPQDAASADGARPARGR